MAEQQSMRKQFRASAMRLGPDGQRRSFSVPPMTAPGGGAVIARPVTNRVWRHVRRAGTDHEGLEQILKPLRSGDWLCRRSIFSTSRITLSGRSPHCLKLSRRHRLQQRVRCAPTCSLGIAGDRLPRSWKEDFAMTVSYPNRTQRSLSHRLHTRTGPGTRPCSSAHRVVE